MKALVMASGEEEGKSDVYSLADFSKKFPSSFSFLHHTHFYSNFHTSIKLQSRWSLPLLTVPPTPE